jgi:hypothetical protein
MSVRNKYDKYRIEVRNKQTGKIIEVITRKLYAEQIGNYNPIFCRYKNNSRNLVKSDEGDLSDPFRRNDKYLNSLYIELTK